MAYSYEHDPINADAKPLYNSSILKFWDWFDDVWSCSDWITWHKANVTKYGKDTANNKFLSEWNNLALVTTTADCKTWNTDFRDYLRKYGLLDNISNPISNVIGAGSDIVDNLGSGLTSASKVLKILLPLILVVIAVTGVVYATKYVKKK